MVNKSAHPSGSARGCELLTLCECLGRRFKEVARGVRDRVAAIAAGTAFFSVAIWGE